MTSQDTIVVNKRSTPAATPANKANVSERNMTQDCTDAKLIHNPTQTGKRVFESLSEIETMKSPKVNEEGLPKAKTEANFKFQSSGQSIATSDGIVRAATMPSIPEEFSMEKQLRLTIEDLRKNKNWKEMLEYVESKESSGPVFINTGWTQKPNTIGSLVVAYLAFEASKNPEEISKMLPYFLPFIVQRLKEGNTIYNQHLLMLLYHSLDYANESFIQLFVEKGGMGPLIVFFLSDKIEMRQIAAAVCDKLYQDRPEIQHEFLRQQGGNKLVQLLVREWEDEESLKEIVIHILNLIEVTVEGSDEPSTILPNAEKIEQAMIRDILENLDPNQYSIDTMELVDELLRALGENNKNGML
jgi:hypothetical protein